MNSAYLFDIDGTILNVDKNFMYPLIEEILHSFSIDPEIVNRIDYAGHTDASIFRRLLGDRQKDTRLFNRFKHAYINKMDENLTASDVTVFEGAVESVKYLHHRKEFLGLLTGNFKETARIKLRAAGLEQFFSFGAFGCHHSNRNYLPGEAEKSFEEYAGIRLEKKNYIIIGDTPHDIKCARYFGAKSVAVSTGHFPASELEKHEPDLILESLRFPKEWLQHLTD